MKSGWTETGQSNEHKPAMGSYLEQTRNKKQETKEMPRRDNTTHPKLQRSDPHGCLYSGGKQIIGDRTNELVENQGEGDQARLPTIGQGDLHQAPYQTNIEDNNSEFLRLAKDVGRKPSKQTED